MLCVHRRSSVLNTSMLSSVQKGPVDAKTNMEETAASGWGTSDGKSEIVVVTVKSVQMAPSGRDKTGFYTPLEEVLCLACGVTNKRQQRRGYEPCSRGLAPCRAHSTFAKDRHGRTLLGTARRSDRLPPLRKTELDGVGSRRCRQPKLMPRFVNSPSGTSGAFAEQSQARSHQIFKTEGISL